MRSHAVLAHEYGHARSKLSPVKDYTNYTNPGSYLNNEYYSKPLERKTGLFGKKLKKKRGGGKNMLINAKSKFDNILSNVNTAAEENIANSYAISRLNMYKSSPSKRKIAEKIIRDNQVNYNSQLGSLIRNDISN